MATIPCRKADLSADSIGSTQMPSYPGSASQSLDISSGRPTCHARAFAQNIVKHPQTVEHLSPIPRPVPINPLRHQKGRQGTPLLKFLDQCLLQAAGGSPNPGQDDISFSRPCTCTCTPAALLDPSVLSLHMCPTFSPAPPFTLQFSCI